jgi:hypothetical protein
LCQAAHPRYQQELERLKAQRRGKLAVIALLENYQRQNIYHTYAADRKAAEDMFEV